MQILVLFVRCKNRIAIKLIGSIFILSVFFIKNTILIDYKLDNTIITVLYYEKTIKEELND